MANKLPAEKLIEFYKKQPKAVQDFYFSDELEEKIISVSEKNNLRVDQSGILSEEIIDVVVGFKQASDFSKNIKERLNLDQQKTDQIVKDVNEEIFSHLQKLLGREGRDKKENSVGEGAPTKEPDDESGEKEDLRRENILKEIEAEETEEEKEPEATKDFLSENIEREKSLENRNKTRPDSGETGSLQDLKDEVSQKPELEREKDMFEDKLSGPVSVEKEETAPIKRETYKGGKDPYRESVE